MLLELCNVTESSFQTIGTPWKYQGSVLKLACMQFEEPIEFVSIQMPELCNVTALSFQNHI